MELFSWTVKYHTKPMAAMFTILPRTDEISCRVASIFAEGQNFYIPLKSTVRSSPLRRDERSPLIEVRIQRFLDKTVIGLSWNHLLTDAGGMAIVLSSWTKALRGEPLPEVASNEDPFKPSYSPKSYPAIWDHSTWISKIIQMALCHSILRVCSGMGRQNRAQYSSPNPCSAEWKSTS